MIGLQTRRWLPATCSLIVLGCSFMLSGVSAQDDQQPKVLDEIVAKVNSEIITLTDLNKSVKQLRVALEQEVPDAQAREEQFNRQKVLLLRNLIQNKVMMQKAEELGITSDIDLEVSAYLEEMRKEAGIPSLDVLDEYFRQRGTSLSEYRQMVREQMITRSLVQQFVYSKITLMTPEVEAYYEEHKSEFVLPASVELSEILFLTEGKDKAVVRQKAEQILARLNDGESFEDLAREFSDGPTAARGGKIGSFNEGSMNAELEKVVFEVDVGSHSGIIETGYGFQIVLVEARNDSAYKPMDEVRPQITDALYQKKAQPGLKEFIDDLLNESYIYVTPKYAEEYNVTGLT